MTKEQIKAARKSLETYWAGSATQSVFDAYASGNFVTVGKAWKEFAPKYSHPDDQWVA